MPVELATTLTATEDDRLLQAEALVRAWCGWHIAPERTDTLTVHGASSTVVVLPSLHVTDVESVTVDGELQTTDTYRWSHAGVLTVARGHCWDEPAVVVFTHGYTTPPAEVAGVVQAVARRAYLNPDSLPRQQVGPFADTYSQAGFNQAPALALLDAELQVLGRYRLPPRP